MKKISPIFVVVVILIAFLLVLPWLVLFSIDFIAQSRIDTEDIMHSISPNKEYSISIEGRMGTGLLNVPMYITVYGDAVKTNERCCTISTQIDNNNGGATANVNVWAIWKTNSTVVVVLMGKEQCPELIEVIFGDTTTVTRRQTPETYNEARTLFETFDINLDSIPEQYWEDKERQGDGSSVLTDSKEGDEISTNDEIAK